MPFSLLKAAHLAQAAYDPQHHAITKGRVIASCPDPHAQAHMLDDGTLLVTGSNSIKDYINFNARVFNLFGRKYGFEDEILEKGHSGSLWHQGFLKHARVVFKFAKPHSPKFIIGHSLGGASAQILAKSFRVPSIGFASPRTRKKRSARILGEKGVLTIWRHDDLVPRLPRGFRHLGKSIAIGTKRKSRGQDHSMKRYIPLIEQLQGDSRVPDSWPA